MIGPRRRLMALAACGVVTAALVPVGTAAMEPATAGAAPRVTCANAAANGEVTVAFVIDFSGAPGAPGNGVVKACVAVPPSDNDAEALAAVATEKGFATPRYASSGLLCAIGGIPAKGCGRQVKGGYDYWAYWQGSRRGWTYATTGPAEDPVNSSVVQGWRWEAPGTASASDPQPRGPTTPGPICNPAPPSTPATTAVHAAKPPTPAPPAVAPTRGSVSTGGSPVSRVQPSGAPANIRPGGSAPEATKPGTATTSPPGGQTVPTTTAPKAKGRAAGQDGTTTSSTPTAIIGLGNGPAPAGKGPGKGRGQLASSQSGSSHGGGGSPWLVIGLVALAVAGLAAAATLRWRRARPS